MQNLPRMESLEGRRLLSVVWINRGATDGFKKYYGHSANAARALVDQAIAQWNAADPTADRQITITAVRLEKRNPNLLGWTEGDAVTLDNNGAGHHWYFDKNVANNSDFPQTINSTADVGNLHNKEDFYTTILHELGHVVGFHDHDSPSHSRGAATTLAKFSTSTITDDNHTSVPNDLMSALQPVNTRRYISAHDLLELGLS